VLQRGIGILRTPRTGFQQGPHRTSSPRKALEAKQATVRQLHFGPTLATARHELPEGAKGGGHAVGTEEAVEHLAHRFRGGLAAEATVREALRSRTWDIGVQEACGVLNNAVLLRQRQETLSPFHQREAETARPSCDTLNSGVCIWRTRMVHQAVRPPHTPRCTNTYRSHQHRRDWTAGRRGSGSTSCRSSRRFCDEAASVASSNCSGRWRRVGR